MSPPVGEVARSARGASLAQHITANYKHDVVFCAKLTTDRVPLAGQGQRPRRRQAKPPHEVRRLRAEHGYSARRRAVKRLKGAKGVWGKTRVFPHERHFVFVEPVLRNSPVDCF